MPSAAKPQRRPIPGPRTPTRQPADPVAVLLVQLEERLNTLKAQVRQAQQFAVLGTTTAMMAHEFNNLLSPVLNYSAYALANPDDAGMTRKALDVSHRHAQILSRMTERILSLTAAKETESTEVSLHDLVERAAETTCRDFAKDGIAYRNLIDAELTGWADDVSLQQVVFNLLINAREAMKHGKNGLLKINAVREGAWVRLTVSDTGKGIPAEELAGIFDPLVSSKAGKRDGQWRCSGLGLALCHNLMQDCGGRIEVSSEVGKGTTFTLFIPADNPVTSAAEQPAQSAEPSSEVSTACVQ